MSLFKKKTSNSFSGKSREAKIGEIAANLATQVQLGTESRDLLGALFLSTESLNEAQVAELNEATSTIPTTATQISEAAASEGDQLTPDEVQNIQDSLVVAANPEAYLKSGNEEEAGTVHGVLGGEVDP